MVRKKRKRQYNLVLVRNKAEGTPVTIRVMMSIHVQAENGEENPPGLTEIRDAAQNQMDYPGGKSARVPP